MYLKKNIKASNKQLLLQKKSNIRETLNLSKDSSTNTKKNRKIQNCRVSCVMSQVSCHVSCVMCHVSNFMCHYCVKPVTCH